MNKIIIGIISILLFISCQSKSNTETQKVNSIDNLITAKNINNRDTVDTKDFADKLLKGLAKVSDDTPTFACMDSLKSNNNKTRDFYWKVFKVILIKSDGALSEVVGSYLISYFKKYPEEFATRYNQLEKQLKSKCVFFTATEYQFSEDSDKEIQVIKQSCKKCKPKEKEVLNNFLKEVLSTTVELKEDN